jgi:hypothetical protein
MTASWFLAAAAAWLIFVLAAQGLVDLLRALSL